MKIEKIFRKSLKDQVAVILFGICVYCAHSFFHSTRLKWIQALYLIIIVKMLDCIQLFVFYTYLWRSNNCNEVTHHIVFSYFSICTYIFCMAVVLCVFFFTLSAHNHITWLDRLNRKTKVCAKKTKHNGITVKTEAFSHQHLTTQHYKL